jgi:hypothetical protein
MKIISQLILALGIFVAGPALAKGGYYEDFVGAPVNLDPEARTGWGFQTGDGQARMSIGQRGGHAVVEVDARNDRRNIWWAMIRRSISHAIDPAELARPDRELRVEVRVRPSAAPRRINLHFNHSRTTDFHSHLMEYDLPDTGWHRLSFTTEGFDALPADEIFVQLAMIDWGRDLFQLDVDYIKVEVVDPQAAGPDFGSPLPYRPAIPPPVSFEHGLATAADAMVDTAWPDINFSTWTDTSDPGRPPILTVSSSQLILLRWDLSAFRGRASAGWGVLELTTQGVHWAPTDEEEFGYLRVVEILGGDSDWTSQETTLASFLAGAPLTEVLNGQMMIDVPPTFERRSKTRISVSPPVLERLISGRTKGLAIYAQGAVNAAFRSGLSPDEADRPRLFFNVK